MSVSVRNSTHRSEYIINTIELFVLSLICRRVGDSFAMLHVVVIRRYMLVESLIFTMHVIIIITDQSNAVYIYIYTYAHSPIRAQNVG